MLAGRDGRWKYEDGEDEPTPPGLMAEARREPGAAFEGVDDRLRREGEVLEERRAAARLAGVVVLGTRRSGVAARQAKD